MNSGSHSWCIWLYLWLRKRRDLRDGKCPIKYNHAWACGSPFLCTWIEWHPSTCFPRKFPLHQTCDDFSDHYWSFVGPARGAVRVHSPPRLFSLSHTHTLLTQYFYPFWSFLCWLLKDCKSFSSLNSLFSSFSPSAFCLYPDTPPHTYTISPLHMNFQVPSFQRCEHVFHQCQREWNDSLPSVS